MLDIAEYDFESWDEEVKFWTTAYFLKLLFKWNINSWFIDEIPDTI